jgi:hypothetical protein
MTAFITRFCKKIKPPVWEDYLRASAAVSTCCRAVVYAGLLSLLSLLPLTANATDANTEITNLRVERADDGALYLSAALRFNLPNAVEDALLKGIPMFFVSEADVLRDRWYWYDKRVAGATRNVRLAYVPLTRRWRISIVASAITNPGNGNPGMSLNQNFDSLAEALSAVQRIARWKITEPGDVEPSARYNIDYRFRLDLSQLPRPFQIGAVGNDEWKISAERNIRPQ